MIECWREYENIFRQDEYLNLTSEIYQILMDSIDTPSELARIVTLTNLFVLLECFVSKQPFNGFTKDLNTFLMKIFSKFNPIDASREQVIYNSINLLKWIHRQKNTKDIEMIKSKLIDNYIQFYEEQDLVL